MNKSLAQLRKAFHATLLDTSLTEDASGVPSIADKHQKTSVFLAKHILKSLGEAKSVERLPGQTSGHSFEEACRAFLEAGFGLFHPLRPGSWKVKKISLRKRNLLSGFEQYSHLADLSTMASENMILAASLGNDYTISPDLILMRFPEADETLDPDASRLSDTVATRAPLRKKFNEKPLLHASISCKWTLRSDRAQNARSEALNLLRNRKGRCPHIVVVTAEPTPSRLSSLALGTGDIDCVYHFALNELLEAAEALQNDEAISLLKIMVDGKRLKDISDLPLDLCV